MRWIASFLIVLTASATAADKVYKIVHPDGTVEYSAEPAPGAEEIRVPTLPTYEPRVPATSGAAPSADRTGQQQQGAESRVTLTRPSPDETLYFDAAGVPASASVDPSLQAGQVLVFVLDGVERARVAGTSTTLDVERGTHTLVARVESEDGQVLATSDPVTFHMRQRSIRQPTPPSVPGGAARPLP